jgi:SAM-dependent methyltransferase
MSDFDREQERHWRSRINVRDADHPVVRAFARQRVDQIAELLGGWRPGRALEVGCGDGFGMAHLPRIAGRVYGCDRSPAMLRANPAPRERLVLGDAYALPFASGSFELCTCWELLHHLAEPERAVAEMRRVSSRCVLVCEPNVLNPAMALFGLLRPEEHGLLRFTPRYTRELLRSAGLRRVQLCSVACFTPNRTPGWLAALLGRLPYRWPLVGLYNLALGFV